MLTRANQTLDLALTNLGLTGIPVQRAWELNERHYGALQGLDKMSTVEKYGKEQVRFWQYSVLFNIKCFLSFAEG